MQLASNTILITGGGSGIGLALAERFLRLNNQVIICGRREQKLAEVKQRHPSMLTRVCDVSSSSGREQLAEWATNTFPALNVLVNNAGIQRRVPLTTERNWQAMHEEIAINLDAPLHLTTLFLDHLLRRAADLKVGATNQKNAAIVNVTSGLAFVPLAETPVYCATKAALHSFTLSLRHQLSGTPVEVVEIIPPAVDTDLGGPGLHTFGVPVDEFADAVMTELADGSVEATHQFSRQMTRASREELDATFQRMNARR